MTTTILAKSLFDDIHLDARAHTSDHWKAKLRTHGQSDVYIVDNRFAPAATTGWHSRPGPSLILVVADGFLDPGGGHVHQLRNETGALAGTIAIQLLPKAADRRIDVPVAPGNCPF